MNADKIYGSVQDRYTAAARGVDQGYSHSVAKSFGYTEEELANIPKAANLGLSCGNPTAIASLREGETVIDLGSGAGFDAFLAASKVGPTGTVYGVDMNKDMITRANKSRAETHRDNVSFVESKITNIPLQSGIADCIISNCVINLVPAEEEQLAFNEMFRLLKPGGRLAISDILLKQALPESLQSCVALYTGCVAGASQVADYEKYLQAAGFHEVLITDTNADLNVYLETDVDGTTKAASGQGPSGHKNAEGNSEDGGCGSCGGGQLGDLNKWASSYKIFAVKA
ncbi:ubiE/COQ5 methyltransferase [Microdochium bolleyi]|uniref:Arsenite methyltransferase n=1 Tax=Microdochium bolleyi TaxID=196109 RepID=A0A136IJ48_9PEZI|nr:ubiE/COQ5 methyltransferase [Microdochium bolleyi]